MGLYKLKGKTNSDHNTICIDVNIPSIDKSQPPERTGWNIRADEEKWEKFKDELKRRKDKAISIITDTEKPFEQRYKSYFKELENAARVSIGKTTFKNNSKVKISDDVKKLQIEKKEILIQEKRDILEQIVAVKGKEMAKLITDRETAEDEKIEKLKITNEK